MEKSENLLNQWLQQVRRIAWRLQYREKKKWKHEGLLHEEVVGKDPFSAIISDLHVEQLLQQLPAQPEYIIRKVVIEGRTEQEVANQLNMSRQGVSKCKRKYLRIIAANMNLSM
ncbi:sigma-70 family RNA polymerase sigma factor [Brevibacillus gelatini]|uniref:Sigma-70 family RNA polymerase sigma factor n=1 Tax=Brevibacillus gelatini TaxID=1655277 RepID=A0A3M8B6U0_9BACL|nr:sigma-70 family RNA polymerase sigma factor [Brevibacillus gelatini]RNB59174.1 sigma-70 family RNA polymerase sigma factor [Brevibacillus gelatini]